MLIEKCILKNYRQFIGKNGIEFSINPKNKITLICGVNASGKTNLLKAMSWCLYGDEFTTERLKLDLRSPLISWQLLDSTNRKTGKVVVSVEVIVQHNAKRYSISRQATYNKVKGYPAIEKGNEKLVLTQLFRNGRKQFLPIQTLTKLLSLTTAMQDFSEWHDTFRFGRHQGKDAIRAAMVKMLGDDYDKEAPRVVTECEKIFKAIIGVEDRYFSSSLRMRADYQLELVSESHGQNFIHSLAAEPSEALSFAFLLALIKVSRRQFPILLDSPFSRIHPFRRNLIIKELGKLRQQVIIVAHDVELYGVTALSAKIGKEYEISMNMKNGFSRILAKAIIEHKSNPMTKRYRHVTGK